MSSITRPKSSAVWEYFTIKLSQSHIAVCNVCQKNITRGAPGKPKDFSTSNLIAHLRSMHRTEFCAMQDKKSSSSSLFLLSQSSISLRVPSATGGQQTLAQCIAGTQQWSYDHPSALKIHHAIGQMIAVDLQPYQLVENDGFQQLLKLLEPRYKVPSRKYFSEKVLPELFEQMKVKVMNLMNGCSGISFTVDLWTTQHSTQSYISLTAHWLTIKYHLKNAVLHCELFEGQHTGDGIGNKFLKMLENWQIHHSNCHLVLHDNGANIVKAFREVKVEGLEHASCFAHTLQLVVKDGLFSQRSVTELLHVARKLVGHFMQSPSATTRLHQLQVNII
jgi:hypothetical protein